MTKLKSATLICCLLGIAVAPVFAQQTTNLAGQRKNYISTGMPIILIAPDAVGSAMGDVGVASSPDAYSAHWNNAKFAFADNDFALSTTYTPWLRNLNVSDMNLLYLGGYKRINKRSTVAASLTYFSLGQIESRTAEGDENGVFNPNEYALDATYSMKVSQYVSIGATARFLRSDLTNGMTINDGSGYTQTKPANSLAADVGFYYEQPLNDGQEVALGAFISNLGAKLSYSDDETNKEFLPTNLRVGGRYSVEMDNYNALSVMLDLNKLLVPTPPLLQDGEYYGLYSDNNDYMRTSAMAGVFNSFHDAPGGMREEMQEVQISLGGEYLYKKTFAARAGYFYEHENKGGRSYATLGFGIKYNMFDFDLAYLIPTNKFSDNPLSNTVRISLTANLSGK